MTPTIQTTSLSASLVNSTGFRLQYKKGNGDRRIVTVTEGTIGDIRYPINGAIYSGNLKFGLGDQLTTTDQPIISTMSCVGATVSPIGATNSKTFVVYEGLSDGNVGLDIIHLKAQKEYQVMVFEQTDDCYATASYVLTVQSAFEPNKSMITVMVYDNKTKNPIKNADIAIKDSRSFISEFGITNGSGEYMTERIEEGRYEISVLANNYEPKIITGAFIQRPEPRRDNHYRIFTSAGNTEMGQSVERKELQNQNEYIVYLDPLDTTSRSYTRYMPTDNPSYLTKI
jgi:hypothetical protein